MLILRKIHNLSLPFIVLVTVSTATSASSILIIYSDSRSSFSCIQTVNLNYNVENVLKEYLYVIKLFLVRTATTRRGINKDSIIKRCVTK